MGACEDVFNIIFKEIESLPEGQLDATVLESLLLDVPTIEDFLEPPPDVGNPDELLALKKSLLGVYYPMRSPGRVILYSLNIRNFFWRIIQRIQHTIQNISKSDLIAGARLVTIKTYYHEIFHFHCDVFRMLFGSRYDRLIEEALAVAYARMMIKGERRKWSQPIGSMDGIVYKHVMNEAFKYSSAGYKDWPNYEDNGNFKLGLLNYIQPGDYQTLQSNNVTVEDLLFNLLGKVQGFVEKAL